MRHTWGNLSTCAHFERYLFQWYFQDSFWRTIDHVLIEVRPNQLTQRGKAQSRDLVTKTKSFAAIVHRRGRVDKSEMEGWHRGGWHIPFVIFWCWQNSLVSNWCVDNDSSGHNAQQVDLNHECVHHQLIKQNTCEANRWPKLLLPFCLFITKQKRFRKTNSVLEKDKSVCLDSVMKGKLWLKVNQRSEHLRSSLFQLL